MVARASVPLIATAISFPPPATSVLLPHPLATGITPFASVNGRGRKHEGMLVAIKRNPFTNDKRTIVDSFRDRQHLEVTIRQVT
jgi:hypothetical protein